MRIIIPSATIAAFVTGASLVAADKPIKEHANDANTNSQVARDVDKSYIDRARQSFDEECNTFATHDSNTSKVTGLEQSDLGILGCGPGKSCEADGTSSLGGRCTTSKSSISISSSGQLDRPQTPQVEAFRHRRNKRTLKQNQSGPFGRSLQAGALNPDRPSDEEDDDTPFTCPENCPQEFCDCAQDNGDAEKCAAELDSVCKESKLAECVPNKWLTFYEKTYCPFAECMAVDNNEYMECSCGYYKDYCTVYYSYQESIDKCAIGSCCDGKGAVEKWMCLPAMAPTGSPTGSPSESFMPSASPTVSHMPTISTKPTVSPVPSLRPTASMPPTISSAPTSGPTDSPSVSPTDSARPTTTPTKSPTLKPTAPPTVSPTTSPSDSPSDSPSASPSDSPTTTSAPTISSAPTGSPSTSMAPTISSAPTGSPSTSTAPTSPPSLAPTVSFQPTASPSTPPPTFNPSGSPTKSPSLSPSKTPSMPPQTPLPTDMPVTEEPTTGQPTEVELEIAPQEGGGGDGSGGVAEEPVRGTPPANGGTALQGMPGLVTSLFVGVGGALWLFA